MMEQRPVRCIECGDEVCDEERATYSPAGAHCFKCVVDDAPCAEEDCEHYLVGGRWTKDGREEKGQCARTVRTTKATTSGSH